jgi:FkbM family methyltransferase
MAAEKGRTVARQVSAGIGDRLVEFGRNVLAGRGLRMQRLPRPLTRRPEAELRIDLDYVLARRMLERGDFYFVQVGAFDGRRYDPIHEWIRAYGWHGLLIEPQPTFFAELTENYKGAEGLEFRQIAVGTMKERRPFYWVEIEEGVTRDAGMIASFDRETLLKHRKFIPGLDSLIRSEEIECEPLNDVLAGLPSERLDLLQIDVEGYDHELIRILDLRRFAPSIVRFEHQHLTPEQHDASVARLVEHGYLVGLEEHDTLAFKQTELPFGAPDRPVG